MLTWGRNCTEGTACELLWTCRGVSEQHLCSTNFVQLANTDNCKHNVPVLSALLSLASAQQGSSWCHLCRVQAGALESLSTRAAFHEERFVWELIAPDSSDPSRSIHKLKWLFRWGQLIYCKRKAILNFSIHVKKPLEYHQCLIFELGYFHEWNVTAFVMSEYYKNRLLMDEHPKGCSSPSSAPIEYKLVLVYRVEGIKFLTHSKCWPLRRQSLLKQFECQINVIIISFACASTTHWVLLKFHWQLKHS